LINFNEIWVIICIIYFTFIYYLKKKKKKYFYDFFKIIYLVRNKQLILSTRCRKLYHVEACMVGICLVAVFYKSIIKIDKMFNHIFIKKFYGLLNECI
jgi:hypothetical protein